MFRGLFESVRRAAAEVARRARFVAIDERRLASFAVELEGLRPPEGLVDPAQQPFGDAEATAAFVLTMATVNFGSGYFPHLRKRPGCSGYFTIARALRGRFEANGPFSAEELIALTPPDCARLFGQQTDARCPMPDARLGEKEDRADGGESAPFSQSAVPDPHSAISELMGLFARSLNDLGGFLLCREQGDIQLFPKSRAPNGVGDSSGGAAPVSERGEGKSRMSPRAGESRMSPFLGVVEAAGHSAERLIGLLAEMPLFRDVSDYEGLAVPFYKRAQLAAADLAQALAGHPPYGGFDDLAELTLFADNLVPHVLRVEGVLRYEPGLLARIGREELIPADSPEEVEIRACAVEAVERLLAALRARGRPATAHELDWVLWSRGQLSRYKALPRHRTRTVFY